MFIYFRQRTTCFFSCPTPTTPPLSFTCFTQTSHRFEERRIFISFMYENANHHAEKWASFNCCYNSQRLVDCCCFALANVEAQGNVTLNRIQSQAYNNFKQLCHQLALKAELSTMPDAKKLPLINHSIGSIIQVLSLRVSYLTSLCAALFASIMINKYSYGEKEHKRTKRRRRRRKCGAEKKSYHSPGKLVSCDILCAGYNGLDI